MAGQAKRTTATRYGRSAADLREEILELKKQLNERTAALNALDQQTATAEVLRVISSSPTDVQPTFDAIVGSAAKLCEAEFSTVVRFEDGLLHLVATNNLSPEESAAFHSLFPRPALPSFVLGRAFLEGRPAQVEDVLAEPNYDARTRQTLQAMLGYRTFMAVPIFRAGVPIGVVGCGRRRVEPFTATQIELLNTFAEQAAIALDNVRLFNELGARNRDLTEALEYQTATGEVLKVISRSTFDLQPVLETLVETATRLCTADTGFLLRREGDVYRAGAAVGFTPEYEEFLRTHPIAIDRGSVTGRVALECRTVHIADVAADPEYTLSESTTLAGQRTALGVPLMREGLPTGVIVLARRRVEPFTERQIELVTTFADQAVIAMENTRLITETREALEQQTATAEVLGVINSSPGDLGPVFEAMLEKAMRLCTAAFGYLMTFDGERFEPVAHRGLPNRFAEYLSKLDQPGSSGAYARIRGGAPIVHITDLMDGEVYRSSPLRQALVDIGGARTGLIVALRKDETLLGVFTIYRQEVRRFSDKQIALLQNFAAQAVIAMENARLVTETREALEQQTATAEVLGVINSSPGDLAPVFDAMLEKALYLCSAAFGVLWTYDGQFRSIFCTGRLAS
jgi:GAF domain-containing protein